MAGKEEGVKIMEKDLKRECGKKTDIFYLFHIFCLIHKDCWLLQLNSKEGVSQEGSDLPHNGSAV